MWLLDYPAEVESDLSRFHRVEDPMAMDSPRYFRLAPLLVHYDGALRAALVADQASQHPAGGAGAGQAVTLSGPTLAAMTDGPEALPGIEFAGG